MVVAIMVVGFAAVSVNSASADCTITTTLRAGSVGAEVSCLQTIIGATADGKFGPMTKAAVMAWQAGKGLVADGVFGPMSRATWMMGTPSAGLPAGCTSTAGYSATTGVKCDSAVSTGLPAGCTSTAGYSPTTGAKCDSSTPAPSGALEGGAGSIEDADFVSSLTGEEVGEDAEDVKAKIKLKKRLEEEIKEEKIKLDEEKNKISDSENKIRETKYLERYKQYENLLIEKEDNERKLRDIESRIFHDFSVLEKALKKYSKIAFENERLIEEYLNDPIKAWTKDHSLGIIKILENLSKAIVDNKLELDQRKNERALSKIRELDKEYFSGLQERRKETEEALEKILLNLPNIPHSSVPAGKTSEDNVEVRKVGDIPEFAFKPREHSETGEMLGILDFERAGKLSGARFAIYKGFGALAHFNSLK